MTISFWPFLIVSTWESQILFFLVQGPRPGSSFFPHRTINNARQRLFKLFLFEKSLADMSVDEFVVNFLFELLLFALYLFSSDAVDKIWASPSRLVGAVLLIGVEVSDLT